jgi:hypothetical protein
VVVAEEVTIFQKQVMVRMVEVMAAEAKVLAGVVVMVEVVVAAEVV